MRPAPAKPVVSKLDTLKKAYDDLAAEVRLANSASNGYPELRARKKAAAEAYWAELHKPGR